MISKTGGPARPASRGSSPVSNPLGGHQTPPFRPKPSSSFSSPTSNRPPPPFDHSSSEQWISPLHVDCHFPLSVFLSTMKGLALHPERNTTFILRADRLPSRPTHEGTEASSSTPSNDGLELVEEIKLRLLPRQPRRDGKLDQACLFFRSKEDGHADKGKGKEREPNERAESVSSPWGGTSVGTGLKLGSDQGLVVMVPLVKTPGEIPYFHPPVRKIAFYYQSIVQGGHSDPGDNARSGGVQDEGQDNYEEETAALDEDSEVNEDKPETIRGRISIHYLPFDGGMPDSDQSASFTADQLERTVLTGSTLGTRRTSIGATPKRSSPLAGPSISRRFDDSGNGVNQPPKNPAVVSEKPNTRYSPTLPPSGTQTSTNEIGTNTSVSSLSFLPQHLSNPHSDPLLDESSGVNNSAPRKTVKTPTAEDRLYRTCLGLLERVYKHGYGQLVGYQKRRVHDVIVARDDFQDLYLVLKERHKHLDSRAGRPGIISNKLEDVKRHVWKSTSLPVVTTDDPSLPTPSVIDVSEWGQQDVAIAAFLMLLWKDMYPARERSPSSASLDGREIVEDPDGHEQRAWDTWGRPEGGFIDLGCGNGLLVHILISEGYRGKGYELRSRRTWPSYPIRTQKSLVELSINPPSWFPDTMEEWDSGMWKGKEKCIIKDDTFIIGNHSDELTPWLPLLSLIPLQPIPHLSLPCCLHNLDAAFDMLQYTAPEHPHSPKGGFENGLEPGVSRYKSYLMWLGYCGLKAGWQWEKEGLRVPSTKGWGIVARKRWTTSADDDRECRIWALEQVNQVKARGAFKVREKEGKEH
ncbi:hypothetical protein IAT40_002838 [Kwoniella sp. CBS 6097]